MHRTTQTGNFHFELFELMISDYVDLLVGAGGLFQPMSSFRANKQSKGRRKGLNKRILRHYQNFLKQAKRRVKVRSNVKVDSFLLIGCQDRTRDSC